ncbi:hypothetical protein HSX10_18280 [Winogradskyella undariae]|uniref:hypothetical protein n=1 Tax=Winogradskyella undariae TaxID=1285465 RepID=UPI00156B2247|nr:hypothetical protein [Winogradskyella undariae]NRR93524.1 hypothetical protein [Winogradskyella undariae]
MNKIEYLKSITSADRLNYDERSIILALINSLNSQESVDFFDPTFNNDAKIREWTAKKIAKDIGIQKEKIHDNLIKKLLGFLSLKKFKHRATCGYSLELIIENLPKKDKRKVVNELLNSTYAQLRKRAYRQIENDFDKYYEKKLIESFKKYQDEYLIWFLLKSFSDEFAYENFNTFFESCNDYQLSKLFLKVTRIKPELIGKLKEIDEISYSYVTAKNNFEISDKEAVELIEKNENDERIGLLIWSIGQHGKWEILKEYYDKKHGR